MSEMEGQDKPRKGRRHKTGVVYLPMIPRFMNAGQAKTYFSSLGYQIGRVFFVAESAKEKQLRKKKGGNANKTLYKEGWIEFLKKRDAKEVVETFNGRPVGGHALYKDRLWNLRYLSGFKFDDLQEENVYKKAMHERKVRKGMDDAKKETQAYLDRVALANRIEYAKMMKAKAGEEVFDHAPRVASQKAMAEERDDKPAEDLMKAIMPQAKKLKK